MTAAAAQAMAQGSANLNPLFFDAEYASNSPYGRRIIPPVLLYFTELINGATDGFPGCHTIWRGCEFEWGEPIYVDESLRAVSRLQDARIINSRFGGGKAAIQDYETVSHDLEGIYKGTYRTSWHRFSRKNASQSSKYKSIERKIWSDDELESIWEEYRNQNFRNIRGADPLYFEDVQVGDTIPHIVKGPITLTSKMAFEFAQGSGGWVVGHELALELNTRYPNLAIRNEENVPEPPVSIHWTNERCQKYLGMPGAYEAGFERLNWYVQLIMNWMGDHGRFRAMKIDFRGFHWQGDLIRLHGEVVDKRLEDDRGLVDLKIQTVTHRDEETSVGKLTVELPQRQGG
ncbi:MAG: MaoC family dehydratase N-terminal domain-containing protein [Kiritimatiellia bacterium]|jgi:acyl dehydratase|nr:MaoC family dehydratase N-terminal domain-containing protein [Pseudomonadales bacterium]MDP7024672.1 MaoC family dehydratase N-terminal domain-containing protein [Kiritimatiellia bacterium]|tara:strand:- start:188 stop:1222 length:1035 start_codon:yes stop_codon:yes gene_type:complete